MMKPSVLPALMVVKTGRFGPSGGDTSRSSAVGLCRH